MDFGLFLLDFPGEVRKDLLAYLYARKAGGGLPAPELSVEPGRFRVLGLRV